MEQSVFQRKWVRDGSRKAVTISIPDDLHAGILAVKARLALTAPHLTFNAAWIAREVLEQAVCRAQREIDTREPTVPTKAQMQ